MKSFDNYIYEEVTQRDLDNVEKYADKLFAKVGLDIEFTKHFKQSGPAHKEGKNQCIKIFIFRIYSLCQ